MFTSANTHASLSSIEVRYARLDSILENAGAVGFVKLDVEGAEIAALDGMAGILKRYRPVLIVELNEYSLRAANAHTPEDLIAALHGHGYQILDAKSEEPYQLPSGRSTAVLENLLCVPVERVGLGS